MNIKRLREAAGMSQYKLAAKVGVTQSVVASWEAGIKYPRATKLPLLAAVLHCTIDELFRQEAG